MRVIFDPLEARRFAAFLDDRSQDMRAANRRVSTLIVEAGASAWRDRRYDDFLRQFDEASTLLQQFLEHAERYAGYLRRKAAPVERYLSGR